jgi:hypothetical protein
VRIGEIFRRPIDRRIEEVIKVDLDEEAVVAEEIDEYVVTEHIAEAFEGVLDRYQETILRPDEGTNIWVSGFFGSGKSSFAKILGYLLANPTVAGRSATQRFLARVDSRRIEALLNTIHAQAPTRVVFVDLSTGKDVLNEGESVVLPLYRALLTDLGYSRNPLLAELEYDLETDGDLDAFVEAFGSIPDGKGTWHERRNSGLARGEASHAMHQLRPATFPHADSWSRSAQPPSIDANWFARRAVELLHRRGGGPARLVFVVDEAGQYVARSVQRMLDLQGLAEAVQKQRGRLWLAVTSQETLNDVVDSLEGKQVELARVQARFPLRVDLLPADIDEVAGKRVLDKSDAGQRAVRAALGPHKHKLSSHLQLTSSVRSEDVAEDEFVRLYPLVPYQIQLLIDAVSARRAQGGVAPMLGGSNRTIIKLAQQLVVNPKAGLGQRQVGALVTVDRAFDLLESIIPTDWQAEIRRVADRLGPDSTEVAVAKALALCMDVTALPLDAGNLAALLHPAIDAESRGADVAAALEQLVRDEVVRRGDDGYRLQAPHEKGWEKTRKGIEARPANRTRARRRLLREALAGLSVTEGRTFKVALTVEGEKQFAGDIALVIEEAGSDRRAELRTASREPSAAASVWWTYEESPDTTDALSEIFRSEEMINRGEQAATGATDVALLGEERNRLRRLERDAQAKLERDLLGGQLLFQGRLEEPTGANLRAAAQETVRSRIHDIYPRLGQFSASLARNDVLAVLRADDLRGLPASLGDSGIGLTRLTPEGVELAADRDPLAAFLGEIRQRANYGNEATGAHLEQHFGRPPYGAPVEVVQTLAAAAIRAGLVEVVHQGARIVRADDARLDRVLGTIPAFRAASFAPQADEVDLITRTRVAERLAELTGERPSPVVEALAPLLRDTFGPDGEACARVATALRALGLRVPDVVTRTAEIVERLVGDTDKGAVRTAAQTWADLVAGRESVQALHRIVTEEIDTLRVAVAESRAGAAGLGQEAEADFAALQDLLAAGDLADHVAEIRARSARLTEARRAARHSALGRLQARVAEEREQIRRAFATLDEAKVDEALRTLDRLLPDGEPEAIPVDTLDARVEAVAARAEEARRLLEEILTAGQLVRVHMRDLAPDPIGSEEELDVIIGRIQEAVKVQLGEGKQVKLS